MPAHPPEFPSAPRNCLVLLGILGGVLLADPALAADDPEAAGGIEVTGSGPLATSIEVQTLATEEGPDGSTVRRFVDARRLEAGEQVYYTIRVTNPGREPVERVVVTKRLPYGVDYVTGSAVGPGCRVELSSDGGDTFAPARGKGAYTHVRWTFGNPLAPGATALLRFRAVFR
jgi:uncharacterized repeat protein (TIGR01451 family)